MTRSPRPPLGPRHPVRKPQGITRAFALNALTHAARQLGAAAAAGPPGGCAGCNGAVQPGKTGRMHGPFIQEGAFEYLHHYNEELGRHEGYLVAVQGSTIHLPPRAVAAAAAAADAAGAKQCCGRKAGQKRGGGSWRHVRFEAGDMVRFELSYKYNGAEVAALAAAAGLACVDSWPDAQGLYDLHLFRAADGEEAGAGP